MPRDPLGQATVFVVLLYDVLYSSSMYLSSIFTTYLTPFYSLTFFKTCVGTRRWFKISTFQWMHLVLSYGSSFSSKFALALSYTRIVLNVRFKYYLEITRSSKNMTKMNFTILSKALLLDRVFFSVSWDVAGNEHPIGNNHIKCCNWTKLHPFYRNHLSPFKN